jgi:hypothetical protein
MPAGGPGDDPVADILTWNLEVFGKEPDDLIRQIWQLGGRREIEAESLNLRGADPRYFPEADVALLTTHLRALRDRLRAEAIERGWEV